LMANSTHCQCDPVAPLSDCDESKCTPFFAVVFSVHIVVFFFVVGTFIIVEYRLAQNNALWRIILGCGLISETAKVIRTGLLLKESYRYSMNVFLYALYYVHIAFGCCAFVSLLMFWARLRHDLKQNSENKIFGRLFPWYIGVFIFILVFNCLDVIFYRFFPNNVTIADGIGGSTLMVVALIAIAFFVYGTLLWNSFLKTSSRDNIFFKTFVSALVTSALTILLMIFYFAFNFSSLGATTNDFLIRHSIYESIFVGMYFSFPSGFVAHYLQNYALTRRVEEGVAMQTTTTETIPNKTV